MTKPCRDCGTVEPNDFGINYSKANAAHYQRTYCKDCDIKRHKVWAAANRRKINIGYNARKYGMLPWELELLLEKQRDLCAICNQPEVKDGQLLSVDHCHVTGKNRELLCSLCNTGIGQFQDNPIYLEQAAAYLRKHADTRRNLRQDQSGASGPDGSVVGGK